MCSLKIVALKLSLKRVNFWFEQNFENNLLISSFISKVTGSQSAEISENLVVKSKLPPRSGCSLETVEPHPIKWAIKFFLQIFFRDFVCFLGIPFKKHLSSVCY